MTVSLCIRQGSKRNDDSVSVEELDWSAERQVLIPAEHLWYDFKYRPWAKNSSLNTNDLWVQSFHTLQNCWMYNECTRHWCMVFGLLCLVKLKRRSLKSLLEVFLKAFCLLPRTWSGLSRSGMMPCIRNTFPLLEWNQLFMKFAWSIENERRSKGEMRGEEMGLWIVLIDSFCVCQHWLDSLLTEQQCLSIQCMSVSTSMGILTLKTFRTYCKSCPPNLTLCLVTFFSRKDMPTCHS